MGYKKILVAMSRAWAEPVVFQKALTLAREQGAQMLLFHCVVPGTVAEMEESIGTVSELELSGSQRILGERQGSEIKQAQAWLDGFVKEAADQGIAAQAVAEEGEPGTRICDLATRWKADLVVIGKTGRGYFVERLAGSIASQVVHGCPCSVLLVRQG